jgi:ribosomal protein S18 acetylase RimI-like enzyme
MSDAIEVRRAGAADAEAIGALTRAAYAKWAGLIGREPLPMTVDYAQAVRTHRFDLLHVGSRLAGLIETTPQGEWLLVENVAVLPEFQGRGLGVRLLTLAEALAAGSGLVGVRLYTNKLFAENLRLYARLGYRVDREERLNGGIAVHMSKALGTMRAAQPM